MIFIPYVIIVAVSSGLNMLSQSLVLRTSQNIILSMMVGTTVGLVVKYNLDRIIIFKYKKPDGQKSFHTFVLYCSVSVFTTLLFWGVELFFHKFVDIPHSYIVGGFLGLALGNTAKYFLDKKFVFKRQEVL